MGFNSFAVKNLEHRTQGAHLGVPDTVTCQKFIYTFIFYSNTIPSVVWCSIESFEV